MPDPLVLDMPVEFGLELMAVIGPDFLDAERELVDDIVNEVDGIGLGMSIVDLERANAGGVIDGGVLEPPHGLAGFTFEDEEFDVHLNMMAWHLLVVALGVDFTDARSARKSV